MTNTNINTKESNKEILDSMYEIIGKLRNAKNSANSPEIARYYAVSISEMEKTLSYYKVFIVENIYFPSEKDI